MANITVSNKDIIKLNAWKLDIEKTGIYKPYLTVRDVRQVGRRHWNFCPLQKRNVHLLSDGESRTYKKLLLAPNRVDVLEQFPLDVDETLDIAVELNLIHPRNYKTNIAYVMTTDFLVKYAGQSEGHYHIAYTFKYFDEIYEEDDNGNVQQKDQRIWQKFEIERQYWLRRNTDYQVVTERDATKAEAWNFNYFLLAAHVEASVDELREFCIAFIHTWMTSPRAELQCHFKQLEALLSQPLERVQALFQYACLRHLLPVDTTRYIRLFRPVELNI